MIARALLFLLLAAPAGATQITGVIKDSAGNGINGRMTLQLSQPGTDTVNHTQVAPVTVVYPLATGVPPTFANVVGNDTLQPGGTYYVVKFYDSASRLIVQNNWVITGATFDMGQAIPTTVTTENVSYLNPVTASADTTFTGNIAFSNPVGGAAQQQTAVSTAFITTAVTSENVAVAGITIGAHCTFSARDSTAATNYTTTWISTVNAGATVTFNHVATAGMHFDFVCTPN